MNLKINLMVVLLLGLIFSKKGAETMHNNKEEVEFEMDCIVAV